MSGTRKAAQVLRVHCAAGSKFSIGAHVCARSALSSAGSTRRTPAVGLALLRQHHHSFSTRPTRTTAAPRRGVVVAAKASATTTTLSSPSLSAVYHREYTTQQQQQQQQPAKPSAASRRDLSTAAAPAVATTPAGAVPVVAEDGMNRYPGFTSVKGMLRACDWFGTAIFAISGTVTAGLAGMDMLGCTLVGTITAIGGGTARDLLIGNRPVFWMDEVEYLWLSLAAGTATFMLWSKFEEGMGVTEDHPFLVWGDAVGVGAFAVIGCQNGLRKGLPAIVCVACGIMTATFGGMTRDVLCRRPPRILHSKAEIYATTAAMGAGAYLGVRALGGSPALRIVAGVVTGVAARWAAWTYGIRVPTFDCVANRTTEPVITTTSANVIASAQ